MTTSHTTKHTTKVLTRRNGKLIDQSAKKVEGVKEELTIIDEEQSQVETGLTDEQREAIFKEIDEMTIAKASDALSKVVDTKLLEKLGSYAHLKGTKTAADDRLADIQTTEVD